MWKSLIRRVVSNPEPLRVLATDDLNLNSSDGLLPLPTIITLDDATRFAVQFNMPLAF
jgi:hypothetical protein